MSAPSARILIVDDDPVYRATMLSLLRREGHTVRSAAGGGEALDALAQEASDLIVLDVEMPGMSGLELLNRLRDVTSVPIIIVSGHGAETERVLGLDIGADDYVVKPFLPRELAARVRALLRRTRVTAPAATTRPASEVEIRSDTREAYVRGVAVALTPREFDLLAYFAERPQQVLSRQQLMNDVWKSSGEWQDPATVTEHVRRLRQKIEKDANQPRLVRSVRSIGYLFQPDPTA